LSDEKNFLQTIKLEISRNFRLEPYERKAFHRILALVKSQQGKDILLRELEKGGEIRQSAISMLAEFKDPSLVDVFIQLLRRIYRMTISSYTRSFRNSMTRNTCSCYKSD
jgi:HEAT repeat protein